MSFEATALLLAWVAIVLLAFGMAGLLRQVQQLRGGSHGRVRFGPNIGSRPVASLGEGRQWAARNVLTFFDDDCDACRELTPEVAAAAESLPDVAFVTIYRQAVDRANSGIAVLSGREDLFEQFGIPVTPFGVVVDGTGVIQAAEPLGSVSHLRLLLGDHSIEEMHA